MHHISVPQRLRRKMASLLAKWSFYPRSPVTSVASGMFAAFTENWIRRLCSFLQDVQLMLMTMSLVLRTISKSVTREKEYLTSND